MAQGCDHFRFLVVRPIVVPLVRRLAADPERPANVAPRVAIGHERPARLALHHVQLGLEGVQLDECGNVARPDATAESGQHTAAEGHVLVIAHLAPSPPFRVNLSLTHGGRVVDRQRQIDARLRQGWFPPWSCAVVRFDRMDSQTEHDVAVIEAAGNAEVAIIEAQADADAERMEAYAESDAQGVAAEAVETAVEAEETAEAAADAVTMLAEAMTALTGAVQEMGGRLAALEARDAAPVADTAADDAAAGAETGAIDLTVLDEGDGDVSVNVAPTADAEAEPGDETGDEPPAAVHPYWRKRRR